LTQPRGIKIDVAKKLLCEVCDFIESDSSGIADFLIRDWKEAALLTAYTEAYFFYNDVYKIKFRAVDTSFPRESLIFVPYSRATYTETEVIPIFSSPINKYFRFLPDLNEPKYLFMVDGSKYLSSKGYFHPERISEDIARRISELGVKPTNCIIWSSDGRGEYGEDFWQYISGIVLRNEGYLVTYYGFTTADIYAYGLPDYLSELRSRGLLNRGVFIEELEILPRLSGVKPPSYAEEEMLVVEAESSDILTKSHGENAGVGQLKRYLADWEAGYTGGIVSGPYVTKSDLMCSDEKCVCRSIGLISCDEDGRLIWVRPKYQKPSSETSLKNLKIVKDLVKCALLRNLEFEQRLRLLGISPKDLSLKKYFDRVLSLDINSIVEQLPKFRS